jgi:hypothetical protein
MCAARRTRTALPAPRSPQIEVADRFRRDSGTGTVFVRLPFGCALGRRLFGVCGALAAFGASLHGTVFQAGEWPVEVTVAADHPTIILGEPTWLSFTVANLSNEPLQILVGGDYQNDLGRPASFTVRVVGRDGKWVPVPDAGRGTGGLIGPRDLPAHGRYVFRLFLPHWATFTEAGTYEIICRRTLQLLRPAADGAFARQPTSDIAVEVRTTLGVLPRDSLRMKAVIDELGKQMLEADGEKPGDEAVIALAWIDDPRVVPYFIRALEIRSYTLKFIAVRLFGRFATEEALAGLKSALALTAADFDGVTPEKSAELAARIRSAAVDALARSGHPQARELLVAQRRDPAERVRLSVVRAVGRMPRAQSVPLLQEMAKDGSAEVRAEAKRHLGSLQAPPRPAARK